MDTTTRYEIKWFMPVLCEWIKVGTERDLDRATHVERLFRKKLGPLWNGEPQTAVIKVEESEC